MKQIEVKIEGKGDDQVLVIKVPLQKPTASKSGKTLVVASTHGNVRTEAEVDGKKVTIGVNAYIPVAA